MLNRVITTRTKWSNALNNRNLPMIISCYDKVHSFKGTLATKVTQSNECLEDYFKKLFKDRPKVLFIETKIIKIDNLFFDSGRYKFDIESGKTIHANYQFIYKFIDEEMKIISHYSCKV